MHYAILRRVWRHGDRTPVWDYPGDPNADYKWPVGPGELTPRGEEQHKVLGGIFRQLYATGQNSFLNPNYDEKEIYIRSTEMPRAIDSAKADMQGFFPDLTAGNVEEPAYRSRISIHTEDIKTDFAGFLPDCPGHDRALVEYIDRIEAPVLAKYQDLLDLIRENTGLNISLHNWDPYMIYDLFHIQRDLYHMPVPDWFTTQVQYRTKQLAIWRVDAFLGYGNPHSVEVARFRGELLKEMLQRMDDKLACAQNPQTPGLNCTFLAPLKFYAYSAHDLTVASLLASLGSYLSIPGRFLHYTVCATMELWMRDGVPYVKILLRSTPWGNFHVFTPFTPGCPEAPFCPLATLKDRSAPYLPKNITAACGIA
ncbi:unnamed protein product, partial [Mesorhabditis spiculigera]